MNWGSANCVPFPAGPFGVCSGELPSPARRIPQLSFHTWNTVLFATRSIPKWMAVNFKHVYSSWEQHEICPRTAMSNLTYEIGQQSRREYSQGYWDRGQNCSGCILKVVVSYQCPHSYICKYVTMNCMENSILKYVGTFHLLSYRVLHYMCDLHRLLKRRRNSSQPNTALNLLVLPPWTEVIVVPHSDLWVARGPGGCYSTDACVGSNQHQLECNAPYIFTEGNLRPTVTLNLLLIIIHTAEFNSIYSRKVKTYCSLQNDFQVFSTKSVYPELPSYRYTSQRGLGSFCKAFFLISAVWPQVIPWPPLLLRVPWKLLVNVYNHGMYFYSNTHLK